MLLIGEERNEREIEREREERERERETAGPFLHFWHVYGGGKRENSSDD